MCKNITQTVFLYNCTSDVACDPCKLINAVSETGIEPSCVSKATTTMTTTICKVPCGTDIASTDMHRTYYIFPTSSTPMATKITLSPVTLSCVTTTPPPPPPPGAPQQTPKQVHRTLQTVIQQYSVTTRNLRITHMQQAYTTPPSNPIPNPKYT